MVKKLLLVAVLFGVNNLSCMEIFKRGDTCKIVAGPLKESGDIILIDGTAHDKWRVNTVEAVMEDKELLGYPAIAIYVARCLKPGTKIDLHTLSVNDVKEDYKGVFYYGHSKESGMGSCFHPTWLEKIEEKS